MHLGLKGTWSTSETENRARKLDSRGQFHLSTLETWQDLLSIALWCFSPLTWLCSNPSLKTVKPVPSLESNALAVLPVWDILLPEPARFFLLSVIRSNSSYLERHFLATGSKLIVPALVNLSEVAVLIFPSWYLWLSIYLPWFTHLLSVFPIIL